MKNLFAFVIGLLLVAGSAQAGVKIEHWTIPTGARVYFVESRELPIVDVNVDFAAGSAYDPPAKSGLAGLTRALLDMGAGGMDEETIAGRLVDIGARLGGSTSMDRSGMSLRTLSSKKELAAAVELMRTVLQSPAFPQNVLDREKARTIAGIREEDTRPDGILFKRFWAEVYGDHPYGRSPTVESVSAVIREDLVRFYQDHFPAENAVVSIVGDLSRAEADQIARLLTDGLPRGIDNATLPEVTTPERTIVRVPHPAAQSHIAAGMPALRRGDPDHFALMVGNYVLGGGGFVSRLTKEVREKRGYAYSVYSYFNPMKLEGPFQLGLQTKGEQAGEALNVAEETIRNFVRSGPTEQELRTAKQNLVDGFGLRIDSNRKILDHVAMIGFYQLPLTYLDDFPREVAKVTAAEVRAAFQRHVKPENMVTVIVGGA